MLTTLLLTLAFLAPAQSGGAPAKPVAAPQADPKSAERARELELQYQQLCERYTRSEVEWTDQMRAHAADPEGQAKVAAKHPVKAYWDSFEQLAKDGQGRALVWLSNHADKRFDDKAEVTKKKLALLHQLIDEHASDDWAPEIAVEASVQRYWLGTAGVEQLLDDFVAKTKNPEFAAGALERLYAVLSGLTLKPEDAKKARDVRERILRDYPDSQAARRLGGQAAARVAGPVPGSPAPEFSGKDVDGAEISLAAARGKVVLLDFWGFWNEHSCTLIPHLKELLVQHAADPFVILGVSSDDDAARFRELSKAQGVSWRSAFEGVRNGPIAQRYQLRGIPALFLIDAQGVLLKAWATLPEPKQLDEEIAAAIAAAKRPAK